MWKHWCLDDLERGSDRRDSISHARRVWSQLPWEMLQISSARALVLYSASWRDGSVVSSRRYRWYHPRDFSASSYDRVVPSQVKMTQLPGAPSMSLRERACLRDVWSLRWVLFLSWSYMFYDTICRAILQKKRKNWISPVFFYTFYLASRFNSQIFYDRSQNPQNQSWSCAQDTSW